MSKDKLGQEPAFPLVNDSPIQQRDIIEFGMSKRFYAACAAMQGLCASNLVQAGSFDFLTRSTEIVENITEISYKFADELLKQENE